MSLFLSKRFATMVATLLFTSLVVFLVLEVLPGDPALVILGVDAQPEQLAQLRTQLGLDAPMAVRYGRWLGGMLVGDFGISYAYKVPVVGIIGERLALTVPLALMAMALTALLGLGLGILAAARYNKAGDVIIMGISQLGISIPNFWFGLLLILLFAVKLGWLSAGGFAGWAGGVWPGVRSLLLPALALGTVQAAILARIARSAMIDVLQEDFIRTARAKGLRRGAVLWRHALRNALIPVITIMGIQFAQLLVGAIVIEQVFTLPGLGRLVFQAISNRDLEVVKAVVVLLAFMVIVVNFVVDLLYAMIDPRLSARDA
jgi:peptide/nickel transport system permease protein